MRELLLEGRVSWRSDRSGRDRTLTVGPARISGLLRLGTALGFVVATALVAAVVAAATGALAASLGARWAARRRERGLEDPIAIVQQQARQAKEWLDARWPRDDDAPGSDL